MRKRFSGESSGRGTKCENVTSGADGCSARSAATLASKAPPGAPDVRSRLPSYVGAAASAIASAIAMGSELASTSAAAPPSSASSASPAACASLSASRRRATESSSIESGGGHAHAR